jgi:hypothetical protein
MKLRTKIRAGKSKPNHNGLGWSLALISTMMLQTANGGVVSEFPPFGIMGPSVRPIERAMREPRMNPQSTVFPAQPCRP